MNTLTLESVENAFGKWRAERSSPSESIPPELWAMALGLYPQYKRSAICEKLSISGGQFKSRLEESSSASSGFVLAYKNEHSTESAAGSEIKLTIQGKERALMLCVSLDALGQLMPHLGALL